jgi:hypothetical protein
MKRLKIMLLSLALLAVVGGALAFKANFNTQYCAIETEGSDCPAALDCPDFVISTTEGVSVEPFFCTTITNGNPDDPCGTEASQTVDCLQVQPVQLKDDGGN